MSQANKKIKSLVSRNFVDAMEEMSEEGIVKNPRQFSQKIKKDQSNFSKIKSGEGRYVTLDIIYEAVNKLGLNANFVFVENGTTKENLLRESVVTNNNNISGNNNKVSNVAPVIQGPVYGDISVAEKIIQGMPAKERKEMKKYMSNVSNKIVELKKTIDFCEKELREKDKKLMEKDKRLMETQEKLIKLMELRQK